MSRKKRAESLVHEIIRIEEFKRVKCFEPGGMYEHASIVGVYGYGAIDPACPPFDGTCKHKPRKMA